MPGVADLPDMVFPANAAVVLDRRALVARFRACAADRDRTAAIGRTARARAERWTWNDAGAALIRGLEL